MKALLIGGYLTAIVAANLLVAAFGPGIAIVNAFLFIGLRPDRSRSAARHVAG